MPSNLSALVNKKPWPCHNDKDLTSGKGRKCNNGQQQRKKYGKGITEQINVWLMVNCGCPCLSRAAQHVLIFEPDEVFRTANVKYLWQALAAVPSEKKERTE